MLMCKAAHAAAVDRAVFPGLQGGPHNHTTAASAVAIHDAGRKRKFLLASGLMAVLIISSMNYSY
jgi:glycine/serine hydroxymethyltransferase